MSFDEKIVYTPTKIDLHIHSAASAKTKDFGDAQLEKCNIDKLDVLISKMNSSDCAVNLCAITDHDCFDYLLYEKFRQKLQDRDEGHLKNVLPGVEFSVSFCPEKGQKHIVIHIVAIFDDRKSHLLNSLPELICNADGKPLYDDIVNAAFSEAAFTKILRDSQLNVILIGHEKSAGQEGKRDVSSLGMETADNVILAEFVDAVEIRNRRKEIDIKKLIGLYKRNEIQFVVGSDCHDWDVYPLENKRSLTHKNDIAFSSVKCLPTFEGLLMAITGSSRIKVGDSSFFNGSSIKLDSLNTTIDGQSVIIPLSPGINTIIGDNSIGKSMLIHALTDYHHISGNAKLREGYKSYCEKECISIEPSLTKAMEFKFDDQESVKKVLEELHTGASEQDYFLSYYQKHVDIGGARSSLKRFFRECLEALESKTTYNDALEKIDACEVELKSLPMSEKLAISGMQGNVSFEEIDNLISKIKQEKTTIEQLLSDYQTLLVDVGQDASDGLNIAISELAKVLKLIQAHRALLEIEDIKTRALNNAAKKEKARLKTIKTDEQQESDSYGLDLSRAAKSISDIVILGAKRKNKAFVFTLPVDTMVPNPMGQFIFVSELSSGKTGTAYAKEQMGVVFNKPQLVSIIDGIEKTTNLKTSDVSSIVSGEKPKNTMCYTTLRKQLDELVDQIRERRKITNEEIGIEGEPSAGLYGRLYFELLAENDSNLGVYVIDQPEDQISQMAIKERVLDAFKRMSRNRQIIMITHNPQFVVNLDVDNVIAFERDSNKRLTVRSGALEYECDQYRILDIVAKTVEGGADVVRKRLRRYGSENN